MATHKARKRFGQNFLVDAGVIDAIVRAIEPARADNMIEIGPGLSALTGPLLQRLDHLTVIEIDRDLAARLRTQYCGERLRIVEGDALEVDFSSFGQRLRIVGNLPYNISTPLLFGLTRFADCVADQHFMLQREVVDRMAAAPGNKDYGRLSVMLQWRYAIDSVLDVAPHAFDPPPRVNSAVVRMRPLAQPVPLQAGVLEDLVRVAFSQRRKLLRHTLGRWLAERSIAPDFDLQRRAEEVPVAEYLALASQATAVSPRNA